MKTIYSRFFSVNRLTDSEEVIREHLRSLRQREAALNALEKENSELHDKVNSLMQEKGSVTRELEKAQVSASSLCRVFKFDPSFRSPTPSYYLGVGDNLHNCKTEC